MKVRGSRRGQTKVISKGKKPPQSGITKGKTPSQTEFQKDLSTWGKKYPR